MENEELPRRLRDLELRTIEWLARLNEQERQNLVFIGDLSEKERKRLERFLGLPDDEFQAGFQVVSTVTRLRWVGVKGFWLMSTVAAVLLLYSQISGFVSKYTGGSP